MLKLSDVSAMMSYEWVSFVRILEQNNYVIMGQYLYHRSIPFHVPWNWQQKMPWEHMEIPQLSDDMVHYAAFCVSQAWISDLEPLLSAAITGCDVPITKLLHIWKIWQFIHTSWLKWNCLSEDIQRHLPLQSKTSKYLLYLCWTLRII